MTYRATKWGVLLGASVLVAGCVQSPEQFETTPVKVETPKGVVTCQLYMKNIVTWDRSIDRPAGMSVAEADEVCKAEGARQKAG